MAAPFVFRTPSGSVTMTVTGPALALFRQADRNLMVRAALAEAVDEWRVKCLHLRFTGYAWKLGYNATGRWLATKRRAHLAGRLPENVPNVWTGNTRAMVLARSSTQTTAVRGIADAVVRLPAPAYINQQRGSGGGGGTTRRTLQTLTPAESARVTARFQAILSGYLAGADVRLPTPRSANGTTARLSPQAVERGRAFVLPQRGAAAATRVSPT